MLLLKRSVAFLIDLLVVCVFGLVLYPIHSVLEEHLWLYSIAFYLASCLYHAEFESVKGATPGQKLFGLRVENEDGSNPSAKTAFGRAALFHFPMLLSVVPATMGGVLGTLLASAIAFFWGAVPAFILAHPDHRGIHEILTRTHVAPGGVAAKAWAPSALASLGVVLVAVIALGIWTDRTIEASGSLEQMLLIRDRLKSDPRIKDSGARLTTFTRNGGKPVRTFTAVMQVSPAVFEDKQQRGELSEKAYSLLRTNAPLTEAMDYYAVTFTTFQIYGLFRTTFQQTDRRPAIELNP